MSGLTTGSEVREEFGVALAGLTTLRVGGPAKRVVTVDTEGDLIAAVRECDDRQERVLLIGGGSNVVISDDGFDGTVVRIATRGVAVDAAGCGLDELSGCGAPVVTVAAGEVWDDVVSLALDEEWIGIEALAGIPGLVGATPMQNVGAYGQEVAQTLWSVRTYDRHEQRIRTFANADCRFAYRDSRFKGDDRYVILDVAYQFREGTLGAPIAYAELARTLGVDPGARVPTHDVREAVLQLRRGKGMVLDANDHDTWSAGSFFTNPVVEPKELPDGAPSWPMPDGRVKTSAAWLIQHSGFDRGYGGPDGRVTLSTKHTLAVSNRGGASATDVVSLAREVRDGVRARFGIELVPEPNLIDCSI